MTEETTATPPSIVAEVVTQTGAVLALTTQNAVFRNGRQLVIPHVGAQFLQELMEALTDPTFVQGLINNSIRLDAEEVIGRSVEECGHYGVDVMETCNAPEGHDGPHTYTDERGDITAWHDHLLEETIPSRDVPTETELDGFTVAQYIDPERGLTKTATVWHPRMNKRLGFSDRASAEAVWNDGLADWYDRLCANVYMEWHDVYFPADAEWSMWKSGQMLVSKAGDYAFVYPTPEGLAFVDATGTVTALTVENAGVLRQWTAR